MQRPALRAAADRQAVMRLSLEKEQAVDWLEKAYEERNWYLVFINVDPTFDPLRDNPRFQQLLRRMKFPE